MHGLVRDFTGSQPLGVVFWEHGGVPTLGRWQGWREVITKNSVFVYEEGTEHLSSGALTSPAASPFQSSPGTRKWIRLCTVCRDSPARHEFLVSWFLAH